LKVTRHNNYKHQLFGHLLLRRIKNDSYDCAELGIEQPRTWEQRCLQWLITNKATQNGTPQAYNVGCL